MSQFRDSKGRFISEEKALAKKYVESAKAVQANILGNKAKYENYNEIKPELLQVVERKTPALAYGSDVWHCWEFSTLYDNGIPLNGVLKIIVPAYGITKLVESKSLKLYLNSWNNVPFANSKILDRNALKYKIERKIYEDFVNKVRIYPQVFFYYLDEVNLRPLSPPSNVITLEKMYDFSKLDICKVPDLMTVTAKNISEYLKVAIHHTSLLRTNCPVTNQPDWGDLYIYYKPRNRNYILAETLLKHVILMRNKQQFHEQTCDNIYNDIKRIANPEELLVACFYTRRGGIDINPLRASQAYLYEHIFPGFVTGRGIFDTGVRQ